MEEIRINTKVEQNDVSISELQQEIQILSQQVKRLIKAEGKLYKFQEELDVQLKEYKDLYQLNRKLSGPLDMAKICDLTVEYAIQNLNYERVIFLQLKHTGKYHVCAMNGFYDENEKNKLAELTIEEDAPFLAPLRTGSECLIYNAETEEQEQEYRKELHMDDFLVYPLGAYSHPPALLVVGNTAENAEFYRKISGSNGHLHSMGNFVGLISSSIENRISYQKMEESERKYRHLSEELEQRVREAVNELRQKDRILIIQGRQAVMGEMISNIAHQWRQPLNILGLLAQDMQLAKKQGDLSKEYVDTNVKKIMEVIQQMSKTIDDFRSYFKPDKEKVEFQAFEAVEKTISMLEGSFKASHILIEVQQTGDPVINGYPGEFIQVLLNILFNARDAFLARNVDDPKIRINLFAEGNKTVVTVTDNAGGIQEEIIDKIFEPYFTTKGPEQGTGVGLFMSKTIIEKNMVGSLTVRNIGGGAEFRIMV